MKLTVDTLDNHVKSAVINVGANNGYVEAFISDEILHVTVYNKKGQAVHNFAVTLRDLKGV
jgi:uncharacterized protein YheU (UPF0270 family)